MSTANPKADDLAAQAFAAACAAYDAAVGADFDTAVEAAVTAYRATIAVITSACHAGPTPSAKPAESAGSAVPGAARPDRAEA